MCVRPSILQAVGIGFASDGGKRKACMQANPLMNFVALLPGGGAVYLETENTSGATKSAQWLADKLGELALKVHTICMHAYLPKCLNVPTKYCFE